MSYDPYKLTVTWFALPLSERNPKSPEELCSQLKIGLQDLALYQARDSFADDVLAEAKKWGKLKLPELLHQLYESFKSAKTPNPNTLRVYKELLELDIDKKQGVNFNVFNISDEQYKSIIAREAGSFKTSRETQVIELLPSN